MKPFRLLTLFLFLFPIAIYAQTTAKQIQMDDDGTMHLPQVTLPISSLLDGAERTALALGRQSNKTDAETSNCPSTSGLFKIGADAAKIVEIIGCQDREFDGSIWYKHFRDLYRVTITPVMIGGVPTQTFTPHIGIAPENRRRVLINLHGGGFITGAHVNSQLESIPIAALGRIKVISVNYRQAPAHAFPAASEDVASVYRELLKTYKPKNIGIYGCSAGGLLTAEALAWFQKQHLPNPGAAGMFCSGADYTTNGDSGILWGAAIDGRSIATASSNPYFKGADITDPFAFPAQSASIMAKYPPSLLISGTRDYALSSVVRTHELLTSRGVSADLHVWEGLGHAFFYNPDLPQSREVYSVVIRFFDDHLGR